MCRAARRGRRHALENLYCKIRSIGMSMRRVVQTWRELDGSHRQPKAVGATEIMNHGWRTGGRNSGEVTKRQDSGKVSKTAMQQYRTSFSKKQCRTWEAIEQGFSLRGRGVLIRAYIGSSRAAGGEVPCDGFRCTQRRCSQREPGRWARQQAECAGKSYIE